MAWSCCSSSIARLMRLAMTSPLSLVGAGAKYSAADRGCPLNLGAGFHLAVAQRLGHVPPPDDGRTVEVGERACGAQYPMIAARRETHSLGRLGQQRAAGRLRRRDLVEQGPIRFGIGADAV